MKRTLWGLSKLKVLSRGKVAGSPIRSEQRTQRQSGEPAHQSAACPRSQCMVASCGLHMASPAWLVKDLAWNTLSRYPTCSPDSDSAFSPQPPTGQGPGRGHGVLTTSAPLVSLPGPWLCSRVPMCPVPAFHQTQGLPPSRRRPNQFLPQLQSLLLNPLSCELNPTPQPRNGF